MNTAIIHSDISKSTHFLRLSDAAGLMLLMALAHCDDYGRIPAGPDYWVITVVPGRKNIREVEALLEEISTCADRKGETFLTRYEVNGEEFFYFTNWFKFQSIGGNYTARARYPHPVLGTIEPSVLGKELCGKDGYFTKEDLYAYNALGGSVSEFLESRSARKQRASTFADRGQICEDRKQICEDPGQIFESPSQIEGKSANHLRRSESPTRRARPPAPAPAPAIASAISPAPAHNVRGRGGGSSESQRPVPAPDVGPGLGSQANEPESGGMLSAVLGADNPNTQPRSAGFLGAQPAGLTEDQETERRRAQIAAFKQQIAERKARGEAG